MAALHVFDQMPFASFRFSMASHCIFCFFEVIARLFHYSSEEGLLEISKANVEW